MRLCRKDPFFLILFLQAVLLKYQSGVQNTTLDEKTSPTEDTGFLQITLREPHTLELLIGEHAEEKVLKHFKDPLFQYFPIMPSTEKKNMK